MYTVKQCLEVGTYVLNLTDPIDAATFHYHDPRSDIEGLLQVVRHIDQRESGIPLQPKKFLPQL
jgi:hypothetical protein